MPKAKSDVHHTYRIELQQSERESLDLLVGSMAIKNILGGVGSFVRPFTQATIPGTILWGAVATAILLEVESWTPGAQIPFIGAAVGANATQPFSPRQQGETNAEWRARTAWYDRIKYGAWDKPTQEIVEFFRDGTPIPHSWPWDS